MQFKSLLDRRQITVLPDPGQLRQILDLVGNENIINCAIQGDKFVLLLSGNKSMVFEAFRLTTDVELRVTIRED